MASSIKECKEVPKELKCAWTKEDDELLLHLKNVKKLQTWVDVSSHIKGKNPKQCSYRYKRLSYGVEKSNWVREEDLKLLELVDYFGERFDIIKTYFENKSEIDIKARYFRKISPKCIGFTAEEDSLILNLYYNTFICDATHKIILSKGIISIRRRLETLLKMKGEEISRNFDIISILSTCSAEVLINGRRNRNLSSMKTCIMTQQEDQTDIEESAVSKSDHVSVNQKSVCNVDDEDMILSYPQRFDEDFVSNDIFGENIQDGFGARMDCDFNNDLLTDTPPNYLPSIESDSTYHHPEKIIQVINSGNFENVFMKAFSTNSQDQINENISCTTDFEKDFNKLILSPNIDGLLEKQKRLEAVLEKVNHLSEMFYHGINEKLVYCNMIDKDKKHLMDLYSNTIIQEKNLILELKSKGKITNAELSSFYSEDHFINDLISKIGLLTNLIKITKMKMQLAAKVYSSQ